jgi:type IV pilus assembly protein PilP
MQRVTLILAAALLAPACDFLVSGHGTPSTTGPAPVGPAVGPEKEKEKDEEPEYSYNPIGKRDPFRSFLGTGKADAGEGPERVGLQKFELDQYVLTGIIWGIDRPRALLEDPEKVGHVAEIGTYVGRNWGKVTAITSGEVVVTEEYQTIDGELVVNNMSLTLPVTGDQGGSR